MLHTPKDPSESSPFQRRNFLVFPLDTAPGGRYTVPQLRETDSARASLNIL